MDANQIGTHKKAALLINRIKDEAFELIKKSLIGGSFINERIVVDFIMRRFDEENLVTDFSPICAIDANISNPHYEPPEKNSSSIIKGSLILIDLWAKLKDSHSVFADITWMAYAGTSVPEKYQSVFSVITSARDAAVGYLQKKFPGEVVYGFDVDDACRKVVIDAGYGEYFFHRTGHSILESVHGPGPNIDNLETEDRRKLLPGHLFSVEPGIYLKDYGFRTEIDVMLTDSGPSITTLPVQKEIIPLLG